MCMNPPRPEQLRVAVINDLSDMISKLKTARQGVEAPTYRFWNFDSTHVNKFLIGNYLDLNMLG